MCAAVAKADVASLIVDGFGPLNLILSSYVKDAFERHDGCADQISITGEDRLRLGFIRVEADEVAEVRVVGK